MIGAVQFRWFREIERPLPFHAEIDCVPFDVVHVHHGLLQDRNYDSLHMPWTPSRRSPAHSPERRRDSRVARLDVLEREILQHRGGMTSRAAVDDLLERFEYPRYARPAIAARPRAVKRPFAATPHNKRRSPAVSRHTAAPVTRGSIRSSIRSRSFERTFRFRGATG